MHIYLDSVDACRKAVQFISKCLPEHLRKSVQAFSLNMSELAKEQCWELFLKGRLHRRHAPHPRHTSTWAQYPLHTSPLNPSPTPVPQTGPSGLADRRTSHSHPASSSPQRPVRLASQNTTTVPHLRVLRLSFRQNRPSYLLFCSLTPLSIFRTSRCLLMRLRVWPGLL